MQPSKEILLTLTGIRKYLQDARLGDGSTKVHSYPKNLKEYLNDMKNPTNRSNLTHYKFDTEFQNGWLNILGEYSTWLMPHVSPSMFTKIKFDIKAATYMEYRIYTLAQHLYGDPNLFYIIYYFNDIQHPSDLTRERLVTEGIWALNTHGIDTLRKVLVFKHRQEAMVDGDDFAFEDSDF